AQQVVAGAALFLLTAHHGVAQLGQFPPDRPALPGALNQIPVPLPVNLSDFVVVNATAILLGKAFFWDQQAGSDGLACASCHFHAGADRRIKNQLNPGFRNTNPALQNIFNRTGSGKSGGPNYTLARADFPFHLLVDPNNRNSPVLFDT